VNVDTLLLHRARVERGIDLTAVAARTALNPAIVHSIDSGSLDALPPGLYARSYVRAFARVVGLDADEAVRQLEPSLPRADDPLPVLRELARGVDPDLAERLSQFGIDAAGRFSALTTSARGAVTSRLSGLQPRGLDVRALQRTAAACVDAIVLLTLLASVVRLTAAASGVPGPQVLAAAGGQLAVFWGVLVLMYFVILGGVGGRTPGGIVCGVPPGVPHERLTLRDILDRALLQ
jgi:hypothetical protein